MTTTQLIKDYLKDIETDAIMASSGLPLKASTKRSYSHAMNLYLKYGVFELLDFKPSFTPEQRKAFANKFQKHIESFANSLYSSVNTKAVTINIAGIVLNHIANDLMISLPKLRRPKPIDQPIMTLSESLVKRFLTDEQKYNSFSDRYKMVWEVTAIMLVTSLRVSDAVALTDMDFDSNADGLFLLKQNEKTGSVTSCPLTSLLSKILTKNIESGRVYTKSPVTHSTDVIRRELPNLFKQYEETHVEINVRKYDARRTLGSETMKMYEAIHPHMLRKTAITLMLANGVSPEHAKFASGHSPNSKSFGRYVGFSEERYQSQIKNFYDKIV